MRHRPSLAKLAKVKESLPSIKVTRWSDLAIGIDGRRRYWARTRRPRLVSIDIGSARNLISAANNGELELLAESSDGSSSQTLTWLKPLAISTSRKQSQNDWRTSGHIQSEITSELLTQKKSFKHGY